jgi:hypothetical protein
MMVMPSNDSSSLVHYLAGRFPGKIGWLMGPSGFKEPRAWLPYAIDNGKFSANGDWDEEVFFDLLDRCKLCRYKPLWVTVPDELANKEQTLWLWNQYEHKLRRYGWPLAFVVQDGMTLRDIPESADVVFVGGSTRWKWRNVAKFVAAHQPVHVGRVNWHDKLEYCQRLGVESCDGTGFFQGGLDSIQSVQLQEFLAGRRRHKEQLQLV